MSDKIYFHAFNLIPKIGPQTMQKLLKYFPSIKYAWQANYNDLIKAGLNPSNIKELLNYRKTINPEKEYNSLSNDINIITIIDEGYPKYLKQIACPPFILYIRGQTTILNKPSLAIVGSRRMSEYGKRVCEELVEQLTSLGLVIVSGLANGIDTTAHEACLNNNGQTIAVLGSGINDNCIFPAQNKNLVYKIQNNGAVISEYTPSMKAQRNFFPARNRIISGLAMGTIVIEAAQKSGALITAYKALEQNREVFAVPGSIYSERSMGCNMLIKKGVKLIQNITDVIEELPMNIEINSVKTDSGLCLQNLNDHEKQLLKFLSVEPTAIDKILKSCRLTKSNTLSALTSLELKGIIKNINNNYYLCRKN